MKFHVFAWALVLAAASAQLPSMNPIQDQTFEYNAGCQKIRITGIDSGCKAGGSQVLTVTTSTSAPEMVATGAVSYVSPSREATIDVEPSANAQGSATITVTINAICASSNNANTGGQATRTFKVNVKPKPVNCEIKWNEWSSCSLTCGGGTRQREAVISVMPNESGIQCTYPLPTQIAACHTTPCDTFCEYTWSEWTQCSLTCNYGMQARQEVLKKQVGKCPMGYTQQRGCNKEICPIDCEMEWGPWQACTKTCGSGTQTRSKYITVPSLMEGKACPSPLPSETRACNTVPCPEDNQDKCKGRCGTHYASATCNCDAQCASYDDCCADYYTECMILRDSCLGKCPDFYSGGSVSGGGYYGGMYGGMYGTSGGMYSTGTVATGGVNYAGAVYGTPGAIGGTGGSYVGTAPVSSGGVVYGTSTTIAGVGRRQAGSNVNLGYGVSRADVGLEGSLSRAQDIENRQAGCKCDSLCQARYDCCEDYTQVCIQGLGGGSCTDGAGNDKCGSTAKVFPKNQSPGQTPCYCDATCVENNDCCKDFYNYCAYLVQNLNPGECRNSKDCPEGQFCNGSERVCYTMGGAGSDCSSAQPCASPYSCESTSQNSRKGTCEIPCELSKWTAWTDCSSKCFPGTQTRMRTPLNQGTDCEKYRGKMEEQQLCNVSFNSPPKIDQLDESVEYMGVSEGQGTSQGYAGEKRIQLTGISSPRAGSVWNPNNKGLPITVTVQSSNSALVLNPRIQYTSPENTGFLFYTIANTQSEGGEVELSISVSDTCQTTVMLYHIEVRNAKQDCDWIWGGWSCCSKTCASNGIPGTQTSVAIILTPSSGGGKACPAPIPTQTRDCGAAPCPPPCSTYNSCDLCTKNNCNWAFSVPTNIEGTERPSEGKCQDLCGTGSECIYAGNQEMCPYTNGVPEGKVCDRDGIPCEYGATCEFSEEQTVCRWTKVPVGDPCKNDKAPCVTGASCRTDPLDSSVSKCQYVDLQVGQTCSGSPEDPNGPQCMTDTVCLAKNGRFVCDYVPVNINEKCQIGRAPCPEGSDCLRVSSSSSDYTCQWVPVPVGGECKIDGAPCVGAAEGKTQCVSTVDSGLSVCQYIPLTLGEQCLVNINPPCAPGLSCRYHQNGMFTCQPQNAP